MSSRPRVHARVQTITKSNRTPEIVAALRRARGSNVTVGVHRGSGVYVDPDTGKEGPTVDKVAWWLEHGTKYMPPRPFMYPAVARNKKAIARISAQALVQVAYLNATVAQGLATIGAAVVTMIQNVIKSNVGPPLTGHWGTVKDGKPDPGDKPTGYLGWRHIHYSEAGQRTLIASGLLLRSVRFVLHLEYAAAIEPGPAEPLRLPTKSGKTKVKGPPKEGRDEFGRFLRKSAEQKQQARELSRHQGDAMKAQHRSQRAAANANPRKQAAAFAAQKRVYIRADKPKD